MHTDNFLDNIITLNSLVVAIKVATVAIRSSKRPPRTRSTGQSVSRLRVSGLRYSYVTGARPAGNLLTLQSPECRNPDEAPNAAWSALSHTSGKPMAE
jgi:hypothetical protein